MVFCEYYLTLIYIFHICGTVYFMPVVKIHFITNFQKIRDGILFLKFEVFEENFALSLSLSLTHTHTHTYILPLTLLVSLYQYFLLSLSLSLSLPLSPNHSITHFLILSVVSLPYSHILYLTLCVSSI